ncbi:recombinase family protein [Cytobacillus sp. Hm23]
MKKVRGIGYLRYSDTKQHGNHSLDIQKRQILLTAEEEGIDIVAWCIDEATSAFHNNVSKRKGIQEIFQYLNEGVIAICFYEESRMTRSITDFYYDFYLPIIGQYPDSRFYSTQSIGIWDPNNPLVQSKLVFASEESEIKSSRAKDSQKNSLSAGKRPGSKSPAGYDMIDACLFPNQDAEVIEYIYYLASWGYSHQKIANHLNRCSITTKQIIFWNSSTIGYILNNKVYNGDLAWYVRTKYDISKPKPDKDIELFKQVHEPIISVTLAHLVKQMNKLKEKHGKMETPYYLRNLIKCCNCNSIMIAKDNSPKGKKGMYMIYRCNQCKNSLPIIEIHNVVLNDLKNKWSNQLSSFAETANKQLKGWSVKLDRSKRILRKQLDRIQYNEKIMANEIASDKDLGDVFVSAKKNLENDIMYLNSTKDEISRILNDDYYYEFVTQLKKHSFFKFTDTELRVFFLMYFKEVKVNFEKDNELEINYRLSPFVSLENVTSYFTEKINKVEDLSG